MFRLLTRAATVSAMLLHSIFGCCTHHAHACEHGHAVENCMARHEAHDSVGTGHEHHSHRHHIVEHDRGPEHQAVADHDGDGEHESHECPHGPCGHTCQGDDCIYTLSSKVRPPLPTEGSLWSPLAIAEPFVTSVTASLFPGRAETGPPAALAACCCRTMTQVWRL
jgi:hypothetical protein